MTTLTPVGTPIDMTVYEEHWDDELSCAKCDKPATVRRLMRCCPNGAELCGPHCAHDIEIVREWLEEGAVVRCKHCDRLYQAPQTIEDIYTVVTL